MKKYILAIDQGTTSTRAILFDHNCQAKNMAQREIKCLYPHSGWVEADAVDIWISVLEVVAELMIKENITFDAIDSIGITNQRETTIVWDKVTGMPVYNTVIWQSRQSQTICEKVMDKKDLIHQKTGLLINPYFSASKIRFILDEIPNGQKRAENGELMFGTIDSWIIYKMTGNKVHATDISNASRTMLFNINTLSWDKELCDLFNIPMNMLPEVLPCSHDYGSAVVFNKDLHIFGVAGDQQAALFGQTCFNEGEGKNTYGTGCFMLVNTGDKAILSKKGLLTTIAWKYDNKVTYALEGSVFIGGAAVQWLRDEMKMIDDAADSENKALACKSSKGIYVVPAFVGLGTPYWDDDARGAVFGLTRESSREMFVRATLEGIAYECKDVFEVVKKETGISLKNLQVDGGATANKCLMQFQSDILGVNIMIPECLQTTAMGASYFAGLGSGFFKGIEEIKKLHNYQATFKPSMKKAEVKERYNGWKKAVKATMSFK